MSNEVETKWPLLSVLVATNNAGKVKEFHSLLADLPVEWLRLADVIHEPWAVDETGDTFEQNAILKAQAACEASGFIALADDSGLEVDALSGKPGVRSARFAHDDATDEENNAQLLRALQYVEDDKRAARFHCALALVSPREPLPIVTHGICEGWIGREPVGHNGFGYDPLFHVARYSGRSMADLSTVEKGKVSHRGHAVRLMRPKLTELFNRLVEEVR